MISWPTMTLAECAAPEKYSTQIGPFGSALKAEAYRSSGVPLLRGVNVNQGRFHDDDFVFIDEATASRLDKYECGPGDVLLVHRGTLGKIGIIPNSPRFPRYIMGNSMLRVRTDPTKLLPEYLYYWLTSPAGQQYLFSRISQVGVPAIPRPLATLRQLVIPVPPVAHQRAVVDTLGPLDDKIQSNLRLVAEARDSAKANLQAASRVDGDVLRVGEIAEVRKGISYKGSGLADEGMPMANLGNAEPYGWLKREGFKHYTGAYKAKHVANGGSILIVNTEQTWRQEIIGWPMIVPADVHEALFSHHLFVVGFKPGWEWTKWALWAHLFTPTARRFIDGMVYGTTVATLPTSAISEISFPVPKFGSSAIESADSLLNRAWAAEVESQTIAALRDVLLPALMSGRLLRPEAPRWVEGGA